MIKKVMSGVLALSLLALSGCGSKEEISVCKGSDAVSEMTVNLTHKGDIVSMQEAIATYDLGGASESDVQGDIDTIEGQYEGIKGVSAEGEVKDGKYTLKVKIDYEASDMDQLLEAGLVQGQDGKADIVSYKETVKMLEAQGLTCDE